MSKLFVGRLAWRTGQQALRQHFAKYGDVVDAKIITDKVSGRSKGFGFVTFADKAGADAALKEPHVLDTRELIVNTAIDKPPNSGRPQGDNSFGASDDGGFGGGDFDPSGQKPRSI